MLSYPSRSLRLPLAQVLAPFFVADGLPFADVLTAAHVDQAFADAGVTFGASADAVFTPAVTLWAFLSQTLDPDKSCRAAVKRVAALRVAQGLPPCAEDTAAYCRARPKLPAGVLRALTLEAGRNLETASPDCWLWHGRHVHLVDGTTVPLPDTEANQRAYPQPRSQKAGLGFPMIRLVVVLSLATAALTGLAYGPCQGKETGETALLRLLLGDVPPGDILLADRYYCTYWLVALAQARGVDVVFRMHHKRDYDFRRGQRLGHDDHVVVWHRPVRPDWMDRDSYQALPEVLIVRELRHRITTPGCRATELVVATTLLDADTYRKEDVADLYHQRWHVELDIRSIKGTMRMEQLRCRTPAMIDRELWAHWLGYNLVRKVSAQAAQLQTASPREVSFAASQQTVNASWGQLSQASAAEAVRQARQLLSTLGQERVGQRPDRYEPRVVKRAPKPYKRLRQPRAQAQAKLLRPKRR